MTASGTAVGQGPFGPEIAVATSPSLWQQARWAVEDSLVITKRNLIVWMRVPSYVFFTVVQPVMFTLLFRYVFGGAIQVPVPGGYVNWLIPGIIAQTAGFASFSTAIGMSRELQRGGVDRIKSMPTARSAFLDGPADGGRTALPGDHLDHDRSRLPRRFPFHRWSGRCRSAW